jgi:hypothetical protein
MATIQVTMATGTVLGSGNGSINTRNATAVIDNWVKPAGLQIGKSYKLKSGEKTYTGLAATPNPPTVARFTSVA